MAGTRPNDLPEMFVGETRLVEFNWAGGAGYNTLDSVAFECVPTDALTFSEVEPDGLTATPFVTAVKTGCARILATGELSSGETVILTARVTVCDPTISTDTRDYE